MNNLMKMKMVSEATENRGREGGNRSEYRGGYENNYRGEGGSRNEYRRGGGNRNEYENGYGGGTESRFRDRTGREHYDNGRFAPMRSEYDGGSSGGGYSNGGYGGGYDSPRMGEDEEEYRRKWTITENAGGNQGRNQPMRSQGYWPQPSPSAQYSGEMNDDGMRRIYGFGVMEGGQARSHYRGPDHGDEMERRRSEMMRGYGGSDAVPPMTRERAEEWMRSLKNEDGTTGPHWTLEQVKALLQQRGIANVDPIRVWVAMNADYSDRVAVNRKYGLDKPDYYLDSAIAAWLNDKDAVDNKEAAYYAYIVK